jgi:hypothetical protein
MKKTARQRARDYADKWFSLYIRKMTQLEYGCCPFCGKPIECCFHWFSRVALATRWYVGNAIGSCHGCNYRMEHASYDFYEWLKKKIGQDAVDGLNRMYHSTVKLSTGEIVEIGDKYKSLYEGLK